MLKKLLKYDLFDLYRRIAVHYALLVGIAVATRIVSAIGSTSVIMTVIEKILQGTTVALTCNAVINALIIPWTNFKHKLYGDQSYLTHTLPVSKAQLIISKFISTVILMLTTAALAVLSLTFAFSVNVNWLSDMIRSFASTIGANAAELVTVLALSALFEFIGLSECGFSGILIGYGLRSSRGLVSVIVTIALHLLCGTVSIMFLLIGAIFEPDILKIFTEATAGAANLPMTFGILRTAMVTTVISYGLCAVALLPLNIKLLSRGVNVD